MLSRFHHTLGALLLVAFQAKACSVREPNRVGFYVVEDSIRTTSNPNLLVAHLGEYDQRDDDHWGAYDPISVRNVTIDLRTGDVFLGQPPDNITINEPLQSSEPTSNYTVETDADGTTATLTGTGMSKPFVFDYNQSDSDRLEDVFVYSDSLERGYFFHNSIASPPQPMASGVPGPPTMSAMPPSRSRTKPMVAIMDLSKPDNVSYTSFHYTGRPKYFNGPAQNHWDQIRVVELRENGYDCFVSAYFYYNETAVRLVGYQGFTRDSFNLNAVAFDKGSEVVAFAYSVVNVEADVNDGRFATVTPTDYKLNKVNIATGETTELVLKSVQDPLPISALSLDEGATPPATPGTESATVTAASPSAAPNSTTNTTDAYNFTTAGGLSAMASKNIKTLRKSTNNEPAKKPSASDSVSDDGLPATSSGTCFSKSGSFAWTTSIAMLLWNRV